jgi:DUF2075 family protein/DNA replication protein DnaC
MENPILDEWYQEYLDLAPAFLRDDAERLSDFIKRHIKYGDNKDILYRIDHGRIKPSKSLGESIGSMLNGNKEFYMIEEQKVVYEELYELAINQNHRKNVVIVKGGPGTGKSVIAINLLANLIQKGINTQYVTRNAAPREVYAALLKKDFKRHFIDNLFKGSGSYIKSKKDDFNCLIVDEAHRLNEKSGMFSNLGENQIKEIIHASQLSIFFIDEAQKVTLKDKGSIEEIRKYASKQHASVYELELTSQFRCNGSDGYLAWLDNLLEIRETANPLLDQSEFDFDVLDDPNELRDWVFEKNKLNNKARLLAGYCWNWEKSKRNDTDHHDIIIPRFNFSMSWNLGSDGQKWLIQENSVNEIGCIHTSQGYDLNYTGVIFGNEIKYDAQKDEIVIDSSQYFDNKAKIGMADKPEKLKEYIVNIYKTMMLRGIKGTFVYVCDPGLREYFENHLLT